MKRVSVLTLMIALLSYTIVVSRTNAQLEPFGLEGENVTSLSLFPKWSDEWEHAVCAGMESSGVFVREAGSPGSRWVNLGFNEKKITAVFVYHTGSGPMDFDTIISGIQPDEASGDSTLLYKYTYGFDTTWTPCDIWLDADSIEYVRAICGYAYSGHLPDLPLFIGDGGAIFRSYLVEVGGYWEKVWSLDGFAEINVIHIAKEWPCCSPLWVGGETGDAVPFLIKSLDAGETWEVFYPDTRVDNTIYSITSHPDFPDKVYAGMRNAIVKTTDGGESWTATYYYGNPISYFGVAIDPSNPEHVFAGGTMSENSFALFESYDGGEIWEKVIHDEEIKGITCMVADILQDQCVVYIGTSGSGVFTYRSEMLNVNNTGECSIPDGFTLHQSYPNPFNGTTEIRYQIIDSRYPTRITLKMYNVLGQRIRTLVDEFRKQGNYVTKWDGKDDLGHNLPSGVYFYRLSVNDGQWMKIKRTVLLR